MPTAPAPAPTALKYTVKSVEVDRFGQTFVRLEASGKMDALLQYTTLTAGPIPKPGTKVIVALTVAS